MKDGEDLGCEMGGYSAASGGWGGCSCSPVLISPKSNSRWFQC